MPDPVGIHTGDHTSAFVGLSSGRLGKCDQVLKRIRQDRRSCLLQGFASGITHGRAQVTADPAQDVDDAAALRYLDFLTFRWSFRGRIAGV